MTPKQYQSAVYFIGAVLILCVGGIIAITLMTDDSIPDVLQNVAVGSLTGLVGLLVTPRDSAPQQVTVVNRGNDPIPVDDAGHVSWDTLAVALVLAVLVTVAMNAWVYDITPK